MNSHSLKITGCPVLFQTNLTFIKITGRPVLSQTNLTLTQEIPAKKKVRNRTFAVRIRTCFRVRISKNSRANQTRASDVPADWTVPGHPKVYVEIGFATKNKVFSVAFNLQAFGKIQLFSVF